ncbi:PilL N-terminal domain-containing protein [Serratia sp. 1D1416]|uniref:PFGI-1 class ICE element type IV pilus protein PilL2 n=1 Tax=Serratia sp. 1D1416 TaxID=2447890 RepID=UPI001013CCFA|nr:PilL N-terminal domain-containing protein [Serratia sp. 1D1416]
MSAIFSLQRSVGYILPAVIAALTGCSTIPAPVTPSAAASIPHTTESTEPKLIPVVRYGRYTLVELVPLAAQRDLLAQVVEVTIPPRPNATVGSALQHLLMHTGYRLCQAPGTASLFALPLPAAHQHLGPLVLRDALLTLAGPAWELSVDDVNRRVCFNRHDQSPLLRLDTSTTAHPFPPKPATTTESAVRSVHKESHQ